MALPFIDETVGDLLNNYVHYITKQMQEIADALWGAENDNSDKPITMPISLNCRGLLKLQCKLADLSELSEMGYYGWDYNYGNPPIMCSVNLTFNNGELTIGGLTPIGRTTQSTWYSGGPGYDAMDTLATAYFIEHSADYVFTKATYPNDPIDGTIYRDYAGEHFTFSQHNKGDVFNTYFTAADSAVYSNSSCGVIFCNGITKNGDYYDESGWQLDQNAAGTYICQYKDGLFVTNTNDQTFIDNYITNNGADHNYTYNYTSEAGDNVTVYYGDNYVITKTDPDAETTYNEYKNALDVVVNNLNEDDDYGIEVPTYRENKYGPEPPPPPPPPEDDDIEDQKMGAGANLASIARLWLLTRQQLIDLHAAFANAPANYDPLTSFIGVLGFGVQPIKVVGDSLPWTLNPINIRMSNGETWRTGVEAHIVDSQVSAFSFPDIHIQRKYNNFLDYSPYAVHEIFIPMCGWLTLPDIAVDRTISVTYLPDLESMKCRAVVSVVDEDGDKCVIGVKDGIMGAEVPFTNLNHSVWLANLITNAADVAGEVVTGAIGAGFTKTNAKGGTYRPYEGFTIGMAGTLPGAVGNALLSGNVNRTHVVGSNGNRTGFSDGEFVMIKSTYHKIDKPDNYDHTIGKVCNKTGQLSEFHGFTVCDNPHIHISALDEEKEEIKRLLEEGVILPSGE